MPILSRWRLGCLPKSSLNICRRTWQRECSSLETTLQLQTSLCSVQLRTTSPKTCKTMRNLHCPTFSDGSITYNICPACSNKSKRKIYSQTSPTKKTPRVPQKLNLKNSPKLRRLKKQKKRKRRVVTTALYNSSQGRKRKKLSNRMIRISLLQQLLHLKNPSLKSKNSNNNLRRRRKRRPLCLILLRWT